MEFRFSINDLFKQPIVEIGHSLIPAGFKGDKRQLWDTIGKVTDVVNAMGAASANAQGLSKSITSADRLRNSENQILYLLVDPAGNQGRGAVTGMLKTGRKGLYVFDRDGHHCQVQAPCVLDFYVHESRQRSGLGRKMFEFMLKKEDVQPHQLAIDRPSDKFLAFLQKHYALADPIRQMNNFVVYDGFFPKANASAGSSLESSPNGDLAHRGSNGLQAQILTTPYGRYGAPRPLCSMGQIIHNQSATLPGTEQSGGDPALLHMQHLAASSSSSSEQSRALALPSSNGPLGAPRCLVAGRGMQMVGNGLPAGTDEDRLRRLQRIDPASVGPAAAAPPQYYWPFATPEQAMYMYDKRYQYPPAMIASMQHILQPDQFALEKQQAPPKDTGLTLCGRGHRLHQRHHFKAYNPWFYCPEGVPGDAAPEFGVCPGRQAKVPQMPEVVTYEQLPMPEQAPKLTQYAPMMASAPSVYDPMGQYYWNPYYMQCMPFVAPYQPWMQMPTLPYYLPPPPPHQLAQIAAPPAAEPVGVAQAAASRSEVREPPQMGTSEPLVPQPPPAHTQMMRLDAAERQVVKCPMHTSHPCMPDYYPTSNMTVESAPGHGFECRRMPICADPKQPRSVPELTSASLAQAPAPAPAMAGASSPHLVDVRVYSQPASATSTSVNHKETEPTASQQQIAHYQHLLTRASCPAGGSVGRPCNPVFGLPPQSPQMAERDTSAPPAAAIQELRAIENAGTRGEGDAGAMEANAYPVITKSSLEPLQPSIPFRRTCKPIATEAKGRPKAGGTSKTITCTLPGAMAVAVAVKPKMAAATRCMRGTQSTATEGDGHLVAVGGGVASALAAGGKTPRIMMSQDRTLKANVRRATTAKSASRVPGAAIPTQTRLAETKELLRKRSAMITQFLARLQ